MTNHYDVLGVSCDADEQKLKAAFRALAKQYHPDKNPGDKAAEQKFLELKTAYDVLMDPADRKRYDSEHLGPTRAWRAAHAGFSTSRNDKAAKAEDEITRAAERAHRSGTLDVASAIAGFNHCTYGHNIRIYGRILYSIAIRKPEYQSLMRGQLKSENLSDHDPGLYRLLHTAPQQCHARYKRYER